MPSTPSAGPLRIIFAGTPEFAAHHLKALIASDHDVVAVYTQPDRPAGRGKKLQASPVKQLALDANIPVEQPERLKNEEALATLKQYDADVMVVVAYGLLLPLAVLEAPRYGCLNVHGSLLPRWRGAAPIQRAIEAGDRETGITIMQMDVGLDTGDMLFKVSCPIADTETTISLHDKLAAQGPAALLATLEQVSLGTLAPEKQNDDLATYAHKLSKEEGRIDWQQSSEAILRRIRAFNPFPVCFTELAGERIRVFEAVLSHHKGESGSIVSHENNELHIATGDGAIAVKQLQLPGKKAMPSQAVLNGLADKLAIGVRFDR